MADPGPHFEAERIIENDHPCLAGHFPGNPLVPGVVLLDAVTAVLEQWRPGRRITGVPVAKFLAPLRPGVGFRVALADEGARDGRWVRFRCSAEGRALAEGVFQIDSAAADADA